MTSGDSFESEVRAMLTRRAGDIDESKIAVPDFASLDLVRLAPLAVTRATPRRRRLLMTAGAITAAAAVIVLVVSTRPQENASTPITAGVPTTLPSPLALLPPHFDPSTAGPVFVGDGTVEEVAVLYLRDRLHDASSPLPVRVESAPTSQLDAVVTLRWWRNHASNVRVPAAPPEETPSGLVFLRRDGTAWQVIAATTDGVDLSGLVRHAGRIVGIVRNHTTQGGLSADVLDLAGRPVPASPFPAGVPGAHYLYATAARGNLPEMALDVAVPDEPVLIRVHTVGGALLTVSEVRLDPAQR